MTNTINQQPASSSLQVVDYLLAWQGAQSPSTRKMPISALSGYYALLTGTTFTGKVTFAAGGVAINTGGINVIGASLFNSALTVQPAAAASTQPLRADQAWQTIATYTAAASSSVIIPLSGSFRQFRLTQQKVWTAADAKVVGIQLSFDGGSTYKNSLYAWAATSVTTGGVTGSNGNANDSVLPISPGLTNANQNGWDAVTQIFPGGGANVASIRTAGFGMVSGPAYLDFSCGGTYAGAVGLANHMALTRADGGNFTGTFILEGLP